MKVKMLLVAAALMVFAAAGFAQNFPLDYALANDPMFGGTVLTTACGGSDPILDGQATVGFYWDNDSNNPDPDDPMVPLCVGAPECTGGTGNFYANEFLINGEEFLGVAGGWSAPFNLSSFATAPVAPYRYFVRVKYPVVNPVIQWTSEVLVVASTGTGDYFFHSWTCEPLVVPCTGATPLVVLPYTGHAPAGPDLGVYGCAKICDGSQTVVLVGPLYSPDRVPTVLLNSGTGCNCGADLAQNPVLGPWMWYQHTDGLWYYKAILTAGSNGFICLHLERILSAEMGNIAVVPSDNAVKMNWNTLSENNVARFDVMRDGVRIASKEATNSASGAAYEYVDASAVNGTTYRYELVLVNMDNTSEVVYTESVTPSFDAAIVTEYALHQNFPNPFNPSTRIAFDLVENNVVTLKIYNAAGQEVNTLMSNRSMTKGRHAVSFDATNLPSGLYFYTVKIGNEFSATKKMLLVK